METKRIKQLVVETDNNLNPNFMKGIFATKENARVWSCYLTLRNHKTATCNGETSKNEKT